MRRAGKIEPIIVDDVFIGFVIGGDHCAEHEWGIDGIKYVLGIPSNGDNLLGIDKRKAAGPVAAEHVMLEKVSVSLRDYDAGKNVKHAFKVLHVARRFDQNLTPKEAAKNLAKQYGSWGYKNNMFGAWDGKEFAVMSDDPAMHANIDLLAQSIVAGDIAAWVGRFDNNPFSPGGLAIAIPSRIPEVHLSAMFDADVDRKNLLAAAKETGIEDRLKEAGLKWFALSPRWAFENELDRTTHKVMFWLNPCDQANNNFCWATVEDLDQWIAGEGPIPKEPKVAVSPR